MAILGLPGHSIFRPERKGRYPVGPVASPSKHLHAVGDRAKTPDEQVAYVAPKDDVLWSAVGRYADSHRRLRLISLPPCGEPCRQRWNKPQEQHAQLRAKPPRGRPRPRHTLPVVHVVVDVTPVSFGLPTMARPVAVPALRQSRGAPRCPAPRNCLLITTDLVHATARRGKVRRDNRARFAMTRHPLHRSPGSAEPWRWWRVAMQARDERQENAGDRERSGRGEWHQHTDRVGVATRIVWRPPAPKGHRH